MTLISLIKSELGSVEQRIIAAAKNPRVLAALENDGAAVAESIIAANPQLSEGEVIAQLTAKVIALLQEDVPSLENPFTGPIINAYAGDAVKAAVGDAYAAIGIKAQAAGDTAKAELAQQSAASVAADLGVLDAWQPGGTVPNP
jgi:hypothetical protein